MKQKNKKQNYQHKSPSSPLYGNLLFITYEISPAAILHFLLFTYISVPLILPFLTFFETVLKTLTLLQRSPFLFFFYIFFFIHPTFCLLVRFKHSFNIFNQL